MKTVSYTVFALALLALTSTPAWAVFPNLERQVRAGYHKNVAWPWPDYCPDRAHVRAPFDIMIQNGWRRQNLLGPHHFIPETADLTRAGELKVQWIMTQAPHQYRQVFVERSLDPQVTSQRIAAATSYAERVALQGEMPSVQDTHLLSEGRPASTVDFINVSFQESMPVPTLPKSTYGGGAVQ